MMVSAIALASVVGVTVYLALHHLGLGLDLRGERLHLRVGAFCAASAGLELTRAVHYVTTVPSTAVWSMKIELAFVWILQAILFDTFQAIAGIRAPKWLRWSMLVVSPLFALLTVSTSLFVTEDVRLWVDGLGQSYLWVELGPLAGLTGLLTPILFGWSAWAFLKSTQLDRFARIVLLLGMTGYVVIGANDLLLGIFRWKGVVLFEHGFFLLAITLDALTVRRIRQLHRALEVAVEQRTKELSDANQRQLLALDAAAMAARVRSAFVANMSHEIRTPLNGVLGLLELLEQTKLDSKQLSFVRSMQGSGRALMHIVNEVLDFSKLEAGSAPIHSTPTDVELETETVVRSLASRAQAKNVEVTAICNASVPAKVHLDRARFVQILTNLVGNAVKFTGQGDVCVRLSYSKEKLELIVTDTGIGIPPEAQRSIFDPFVQVDSSLRREAGGTGLGLAITKHLVELMGGEIALTSRVGTGSRFSVMLPASCAEERETPELRSKLEVVLVTRSPLLRACLAGHCAALGYRFRSIVAEEVRSIDGTNVFLLIDDASLEVSPQQFRGVAWVRRLAENTGDTPSLFKPVLREELKQVLEAKKTGVRMPVPAIATTTNVPALDTSSHVLVAEDNEVNQLVIKHMLRHLGVAATLVKNGQEAVEAWTEDRLTSARYKAVLMDCQMPVLDGYEATRQIREMERAKELPRIPVIAVTAHAIQEERERAESSGFDDYLTKPLNLDALRKSLERMGVLKKEGEKTAG